MMNMSIESETVTCKACGRSFHSEEEKENHIKESHMKPKT